MTVALDQQVERFREEVRTFLESAIDPRIPAQGPLPQADTPEKQAFVYKLADRGWLGLSWPVEYGGRGLDPIYQVVLQEELEYAHMPSLAIEINMVGATILRHGSESMKTAVLPKILAGGASVALGYSEPEAGSDLANLQLRAERDGDHFRLNGQKLWTSAAHFADFIWLACRTEPDLPRHEGISLFLVDTDSAGIEVHPIETMGEHPTNVVFFDDVRVPDDRLVGDLNSGWNYIVEALDLERVTGFPFGALQRDLDELVAWARSDDDRWADPAVRSTVARLSLLVEAARTHLDRCLEVMGRGLVPTIEAAMLKISMTEARQEIADSVVELLGSPGLLRSGEPAAPMDGRFEHNWRAEIITTIAGGANEIQRNIIARRHLRLPGS